MTNENERYDIADFKLLFGLKKVIVENKEGFTVGLNLEKPKHKKGFYVSITNNKGKNPDVLIKNLLDLKGLVIANQNLFIGGWVDGEDFYLDFSKHTNELNEALKIGRLFNQLAVWDIANNQSIAVGQP